VFPQGGPELGDSVEQIEHETDRRVIGVGTGVQPLDPTEVHDLLPREGHPAVRPPDGFEESEPHKSPDQLGMDTRYAGEGLQIYNVTVRPRPGPRLPHPAATNRSERHDLLPSKSRLGLKVELSASCSNSRRSSSLSRAGTMTLASA